MNKIITLSVLLTATSNLLLAGGNVYQPIEPTINIPQNEVVLVKDDNTDQTIAVVNDNVRYDGFYMGGALSYLRMNEIVESRGHALTLLGGYYMNKYLGVEARYTTTLTDIDEDQGKVTVSVDKDLSNVGIYLKAMYNLTTGFSAYGLAGYGQSEVGRLDEDGVQWGIGTKYELANGVGFFFDYMSFYDDDDFDTLKADDVFFSTTNVGVTYTF